MNKNIVYGGILIAIVIAVSGLFFPKAVTQILGSGTRYIHGLSTDSTSPSSGEVRTTTLTVTATSTIGQSVDGLVAGGSFTVSATGTPVTAYANTTGPKICDASTGYVYLKNDGSYSPSLVVGMGTSSSAAYSVNLLASSTAATSTTSYFSTLSSLFLLANGDEITVSFSDPTNTEASSTNYAHWSAEAGVWCQDVSI